MSKKFFIYSVVLKSLIIGFLISGFTVILVSGIVNMDFSTFTYFTIISNIFTFITTIFFLICTIKRYKGFYLRPNKVFFIFRFFSLIAITITGFIFDFLIVPIGGIQYLMSYQSVCFHVIIPVLAILDFLTCNRTYKIKVSYIFLALIYPVIYLCFEMALSYSGFRWDNGTSVAPYPFLDYKTNTWFTIGDGKMGVLYWIFVLIAIFIGVGFLYKLFQFLIKRRYLNTFD